MYQDELLSNQAQIKAIQDKYKSKKQQAWDAHKEIVRQEKQELENLLIKNEELRELVIDDHDFIDGITRSSTKDYRVVDFDALPMEYKELKVNDKLIKQEMKMSEYTKPIPGIEVFDKYSIRVSLK